VSAGFRSLRSSAPPGKGVPFYREGTLVSGAEDADGVGSEESGQFAKPLGSKTGLGESGGGGASSAEPGAGSGSARLGFIFFLDECRALLGVDGFPLLPAVAPRQAGAGKQRDRYPVGKVEGRIGCPWSRRDVRIKPSMATIMERP